MDAATREHIRRERNRILRSPAKKTARLVDERLERDLERAPAESPVRNVRPRHIDAEAWALPLRRNKSRRQDAKRRGRTLKQYDPVACGELLMELRAKHPDLPMHEVADMFDWKNAPLMDPNDSMQRVAQAEYAETLGRIK